MMGVFLGTHRGHKMAGATLLDSADASLRAVASWEGREPSRELVLWVFALLGAGLLIEADGAQPTAPGEVALKRSVLDPLAEQACLGIGKCLERIGMGGTEVISPDVFGNLVGTALGILFDPRLEVDASLSGISEIFEDRWREIWRGYAESERRMFLLVTDRIMQQLSSTVEGR